MTNVPPHIHAQIGVSSRGADAFVSAYYKVFDTSRHLLGKLYRDTSKVVWNGNGYAGLAVFSDFVTKLPVSYHEIHSYDVQPIISPTLSPTVTTASDFRPSLLVAVGGHVKYGAGYAKQFAQTFILNPEVEGGSRGNTYYVACDTFRFV